MMFSKIAATLALFCVTATKAATDLPFDVAVTFDLVSTCEPEQQAKLDDIIAGALAEAGADLLPGGKPEVFEGGLPVPDVAPFGDDFAPPAAAGSAAAEIFGGGRRDQECVENICYHLCSGGAFQYCYCCPCNCCRRCKPVLRRLKATTKEEDLPTIIAEIKEKVAVAIADASIACVAVGGEVNVVVSA